MALITAGNEVHEDTSEDLFFNQVVSSYVDTPRFVHRDWLAEDLQTLIEDLSCRFVLITGEPGCGKSSFIAQLARAHADWPVYFIRRDEKTTLGAVGARSFLLRIGFELAALYPGAFDLEQIHIDIEQQIGMVAKNAELVAARIEAVRISPFQKLAIRIKQSVERNMGQVVGLQIDELITDSLLLGTPDLQEVAIFRPARNLRRLHPEHRVVILIDALDELQYADGQDHILGWLTNCSVVPENVRFVVTSRPTEIALSVFESKQAERLRRLQIHRDDPRIRSELDAYAESVVSLPEVVDVLRDSGRTAAEFVTECVAKSDGNIGYLAALGRAIDHHITTPEHQALLRELLSLKQLPSELSGLYAFFMNQVMTRQLNREISVTDPVTTRKALVNAWSDLYYPLLSVFAVCLQPLTVMQLQALSGTLADLSQIHQALYWLSQFLGRIGSRYRLCHATLAEFLTATETRDNPERAAFYVNSVKAHVGVCTEIERDDVKAIWRNDSGDNLVQARREYARQRYIKHLFLSRNQPRLFSVLDQGDYGHGKIAADPSTLQYALDLDT
jgi:hypothetical protein